MKSFESKIGVVTMHETLNKAIGFLLKVDRIDMDDSKHTVMLDFIWNYGKYQTHSDC